MSTHSPENSSTKPLSPQILTIQPESLKKERFSKICEVCSDKAIGFNFGAISCESCKAFFRRNALKHKKTGCLFKKECNIDANTRRFCPSCRLAKCFSIGMKKEMILDESQKQKRLSIRGKKKHKLKEKDKVDKVIDDSDISSQSIISSSCSSSPPIQPASSTVNDGTNQPMIPVSSTPISTSTTEDIVKLASNSFISLEGSQPDQSVSYTSTEILTHPVVDDKSVNIPTLPPVAILAPFSFSSEMVTSDTLVQPTQVTDTQSIISISPITNPVVTLSMPSQTLSTQPDFVQNEIRNLLSLSTMLHSSIAGVEKTQSSSSASSGTQAARILTSDERSMIHELENIYFVSFTADVEPLIHLQHEKIDPTLNQLINQSGISVLRFIKFAKRLDEFTTLSQECQIGILKGATIHILLLRSISIYDAERDLWVTPRGNISTEILINATGLKELHDNHVKYSKSLKAIIKDDLILVSLLIVIVLFSPDLPNICNRELVSNIQDKYIVLLKHYLESKFFYNAGADIFQQLLTKLTELKELAEMYGRYMLDVNPREIEPLMLEILDLK